MNIKCQKKELMRKDAVLSAVIHMSIKAGNDRTGSNLPILRIGKSRFRSSQELAPQCLVGKMGIWDSVCVMFFSSVCYHSRGLSH